MYAIIENGKPYMQLIFLSGAYFVAFGWQQFSVLNAVALLIPVTIPLSLLKPQTGLPVILTRLTARGVIASIVVVLLSFVINPGWPLAWSNTARNFDGVIPLLTLPLGPLMLLALNNWRNPDAWVLLLFACVPQRSVYDLVPLLLLAKSGKQMGLFMILSWLPVLLGFSVLAVPSINVHYSLAFIYLPILIMQLYTSRKQPC